MTVLALYAPQRPLTMMGLQTDTFFVLICAALAVWGMCQGVGTAPLEALLADSVPTGEHCMCCSRPGAQHCLAESQKWPNMRSCLPNLQS